MSETIHILLVNVELGPFSERQVRESIAAGHLLPTDSARPIWKENWAPLSEVLANLPLPIVVAERLPGNPAPSDFLPDAAVLAAPILFAPPIGGVVSPPDILHPATVWVVPIKVLPPLLGIAPQPKTLTPAVVLAPHAFLEPPSTAVPDSATPERMRAIVRDSPAQTTGKEREIAPPPEPVVPYNQPRPIPPTFVDTHWQLWGRYAAIVLVLLAVWTSLNWSMIEPTVLHDWSELNLELSQLIDDFTSRLRPPS